MFKMDYSKECELSKLNQFVGHRVEVSFNTYTHNNNVMVTFVYDNFDFDNGEYILCLFNSNDENLNTRLEKNLILKSTYLDDNIYNDVISVYTKDFILSVTTLEKPISIPHCDKCDKEFDKYEHIWYVNQQAGYGSSRDGDNIQVKICNHCFENMFHSVPPSLDSDEEEFQESPKKLSLFR